VIGFILFSIQLNTFNPRYTQFELAFRFFFLISAIVTTVRWLWNRTQWNLTCLFQCLFTKSMRRFSILDWSLEQRWMVFLLAFLVFYNGNNILFFVFLSLYFCLDPFYPLTFLSNSSFPSILDGILQVTFFCTLLLFWLSVYHGIRQVCWTKRILFFIYQNTCLLTECSSIHSILSTEDYSR